MAETSAAGVDVPVAEKKQHSVNIELPMKSKTLVQGPNNFASDM